MRNKKINTNDTKPLIQRFLYYSYKFIELKQDEHKHFHPSGNVEPSEQDIYITKRMAAVYGLMGIELMDHLIVGNEETYYSFAESREMPKNDITFNNLINQDTGLEI